MRWFELKVFDRRRTFDCEGVSGAGGGGESIEFGFDISSKLLFSDMIELFSELVTSDIFFRFGVMMIVINIYISSLKDK